MTFPLTQVISSGSQGPQGVQGAQGYQGTTANLTALTDLIPASNVTYDLGTNTHRWKDLYLSGNTINLGGATIGSTGDVVTLPTGSTIGGVNPGTLVLLNSVANSAALPYSPTPSIGDAYVVLDGVPTPHLWVWVGDAYVDMGIFQGPTGSTGSQGPQGAAGVGNVVYDGGGPSTDFSVGLNINCGGVN